MSRKLLTLVGSALLCFAFGTGAFAQPTEVQLLVTGGTTFPDTINGLDAQVGRLNTYSFDLQARSDTLVAGATLGLILYSPDGSLTAVNLHDIDSTAVFNSAMSLTGAIISRDIDGTLPEQWLIGGAASPLAAIKGFKSAAFVTIETFQIDMPDADGVLCIDSAFYPPSGEWLFADAASNPFIPAWNSGGGDGPVGGSRPAAFCMTTFTIPDLPPVCHEPLDQAASHDACSPFVLDMHVEDPDGPSVITYTVSHDGAGNAVVNGAGVMTYTPDPADRGNVVTVTVTGTEDDGPSGDCVAELTVTNAAPVATCPPSLSVSKGSSRTSPDASATDANLCDLPLVWSIVSVTPAPIGTYSINPATGAVTFNSDVNDAPGVDSTYTFCIAVSDGVASDTCCFSFTVLNTEPFCVEIGQTGPPFDAGTIQGGTVEICITFAAGSNEVGGFDFLISYDHSSLSFLGATEGSIYPDYEWEYFTYRYGANGNCSGGCPSGVLRIVGLAEQNDGAHHPSSTQLVAGDTFACMTFLVSNDRNLECQFVPIRWLWLDCGDNTMSSPGGDTLYISNQVLDYVGTDDNVLTDDRADITGSDQTFPTLTGAPDVCDVETEKGEPIRFICFGNGGIKIICADSIDARGDINLNGLSNEIADAVMFTEYFVKGLVAFGTHADGSIAASEVNGDGIPLTVADLVYLIRVIVGDALPLPKLSHEVASVNISVTNGVISSDVEMGAALFVFDGAADVELLAKNMDIKVGVVDGNTHALVYSLDGESIAAGEVVSSNGRLSSVEAADYNGVALSAGVELPKNFAVYQNYPNPFNPSTKIAFDVPSATEYVVSIYNVAGQKVSEITGEADAGRNEVVWQANDFASGVYFYKVTAGVHSNTLKMVLLK